MGGGKLTIILKHYNMQDVKINLYLCFCIYHVVDFSKLQLGYYKMKWSFVSNSTFQA